ncbi:hypothetical protein N9060_00640 [Arenicella sp.]|nr:hypothetical protein [Arenicella sp.]
MNAVSQPMQPHSKVLISAHTFFRLVILAVIVRISLMPFFAHVDVLSEARRIYFWDVNGIYFDDISRNVTALFQLLFFKITSIFINNKEALFAHADMQNSTASVIDYFQFVSQENIFRALFLLKLPYLVADMITAWAIYVYCDRSPSARYAVLFWLFNPISIFAFYIYGRFEAIPIMFCILSLLALKRHNLLLAAVMTGLSINSREMYIFLGPLFVALVCSPSCKNYGFKTRLVAILIVTFAVAVAVQLISVSGVGVDSFGREVVSIASEGRADYLFRFIVGSYLIFPMAYFFILLYAWNSKVDLSHKAILLYGLVLMAFFSFSEHTTYYTSWMMIFPCIFLSYHGDFLKPLLVLCFTWFLFNLSITDAGVFTTFLASPWSISFAGLPSFPNMYRALGFEGILDLTTYQRLCRTMYCGSILYLAYLMLSLYRKQTSEISR